MKITKRKLSKLIRESLPDDDGMLKIIDNPHSPETKTYNRIVNYALRNDIAGALADTQVNTPDLALDLDEIQTWIEEVEAEHQDPGGGELSTDVVYPPNWNEKKIFKFLTKLENAWYKDQTVKDSASHDAEPNKPERAALSYAFAETPVLHRDVEFIDYQIHKTKKWGTYLRLKDREGQLGNMEAILDKENAELDGTTVEDVLAFLVKNGASQTKRRKLPRRQYGSYYD
jgi:hypothetical protein